MISFLRELRQRIRFWRTVDRIGPDIPWTSWRMHFPSLMRKFCQARFRYFADTAVVRPGVYVISCASVSLGERVVLRPGTMVHGNPEDLSAEIRIEDDVLLGAGVQIYVDNHEFGNPDVPIIDQRYPPPRSVVIRRGAWIGANAVLLPGVEIGENAVVGAGSIVTRSVPMRTVASGVPARVIRKIGQLET